MCVTQSMTNQQPQARKGRLKLGKTFHKSILMPSGPAMISHYVASPQTIFLSGNALFRNELASLLSPINKPTDDLVMRNNADIPCLAFQILAACQRFGPCCKPRVRHASPLEGSGAPHGLADFAGTRILSYVIAYFPLRSSPAFPFSSGIRKLTCSIRWSFVSSNTCIHCSAHSGNLVILILCNPFISKYRSENFSIGRIYQFLHKYIILV